MDYIHWNVDREIFHLFGPIALRWYSLLFLSGFLIGKHFLTKMAYAEGKNGNNIESLLFYLVVGTVVGARLGHCLFYDPEHYLSAPLEILKVWEGGLASHGGYLGVMIASYLFSRRHPGMSFLWTMDRVSIWAILTGAFIRIGNLFNSEIPGKVTTVPWAFVFEKLDGLPRHPTQIYEALGYALTSLILYLVYRLHQRKPPSGLLFGLVLVLGYSFRSFIELFKENQVAFEDGMLLNMGQLLSLPFIFIGFFLIFGWHKRFKCLSFLTYEV